MRKEVTGKVWNCFQGALESKLAKNLQKQCQIGGQGGQSAYVYCGINIYDHFISFRDIEAEQVHRWAIQG